MMKKTWLILGTVGVVSLGAWGVNDASAEFAVKHDQPNSAKVSKAHSENKQQASKNQTIVKTETNQQKSEKSTSKVSNGQRNSSNAKQVKSETKQQQVNNKQGVTSENSTSKVSNQQQNNSAKKQVKTDKQQTKNTSSKVSNGQRVSSDKKRTKQNPNQSQAPVQEGKAKFDMLSSTDQLVALISNTYEYTQYEKFTGSQFKIYMGVPNQIVIQDVGEGTGSWVDHTVRITDNHDGTFTLARPTSDTARSNAVMSKDNSYWKVYGTTTKYDVFGSFNGINGDSQAKIRNSIDTSTQTSDFSTLPANQNSVVTSNETNTNQGQAPAQEGKAKFDILSPTDQLVALISNTYEFTQYEKFTGSQFKIYMGVPNQIVIQDVGEGTGNWVDHTVRITDNHDGTFTLARPASDIARSNAEMSKDNSYWNVYGTTTKYDVFGSFNGINGDSQAKIRNSIDTSTQTSDFPILPANQNSVVTPNKVAA
ncbi:hypothetical protein [Weissella minor]|nr:hypothetical protein [Weissella minor]